MKRLLLCLATMPALALAQADMTLYNDGLQNGWQDWSWCTRDLASTEFVHAGARSTKLTMSGWSGFYLSRGAMSSAGYESLNFYIHGGTVNGRTLRVQALVDGNPANSGVNPNTYIAGGSIAAGQWRLATIPFSALGVSNVSNLTGFWIQEYTGGTQAPFYVDDITLTAQAPPSVVNLSVNLGQVLQNADSRMFAVNATMWDTQFNNSTTRGLLTAMNNRALRYPGGSLSDEYHWATNTTRNNTWTWALGFDAFAGVARDTNAQVVITTNYGSGTPAEARAWVQYSNVTRGYGFKYWEIGNECYGTWEYDTRSRPHDPYSYALAAKDYIQQMKLADPTVKVGVVIPLGEDSFVNYTDHPATNLRTLQQHNGWGPVMLENMRLQGVLPDFVIYHKYHQEPTQESDAGLLQSSSTWSSDIASLRQMMSDYLGASHSSVEIVCTENNSVSYNPGKQTTSLVNGLFWADSISQAMKTELKGLFWWDMRNSSETGNNNSSSLYGWRNYGDYGIVSIANGDSYPSYYTAKLMKEFARGGEQVLATSSDYSLLSVYACRKPGGSTRLLVINKSPTLNLTGSISMTGIGAFSPAGALHRYGIPQDEAARTGAGNRDVTSSWLKVGRSMSVTFPPYSVSVIVLPPKGIVPHP